MRTIAKFLGATAVGLFALSVTAQDRPGEKGGALKLEGTYTIVSGEEGGELIPEPRIKGAIVKFTADKITATDKDKKEFFAAIYKMDTGKTPYRIMMKSTTPKEAETTGLIEKKGETVRVIYALPGGEEPTEFKTKEKQQMFVLKPAPGKPDPKNAVDK
jgi:uncharacterized protein (TIGR03067 family)